MEVSLEISKNIVLINVCSVMYKAVKDAVIL